MKCARGSFATHMFCAFLAFFDYYGFSLILKREVEIFSIEFVDLSMFQHLFYASRNFFVFSSYHAKLCETKF